MADDDRDDNPVATGLLALVGVGLVVGLLVAGAALAVSQVAGLGDGGSGGGTATARQSMYLPTPTPTEEPTGPLITLAPEPGADESLAEPAAPTAPATPSATAPAISLTASTAQARPGDKITLTGTYTGGEGAQVVVERLTGDTWGDFAGITATVRGSTFSTYIRTSQGGVNTFRVRDTATDLTSNEITFTIG